MKLFILPLLTIILLNVSACENANKPASQKESTTSNSVNNTITSKTDLRASLNEALNAGQLTEQEPAIVASIKPIQLLVDAIRHGKTSAIEGAINSANSTVENSANNQTAVLLNANQDHHLHSLKPSQRKVIANADLIFYISDAFEAYMHKVRLSESKTANNKFIALGETPKLRILQKRKSGELPHSLHDDEEIAASSASDNHSNLHHSHHSHGHDDHQESAADWHIWLNPDNAILMLEKIKDELSLREPAKAQQFELNYISAKQAIADNSALITERLMNGINKPFITLHDGYQYFEEQYGVYSAGTIYEGGSHNSPSIKHVIKLKELVKAKDIRCGWREFQYPDSSLKTVFGEEEFNVAVIDSLGQNQENQATSYIELMNNIADQVAPCLMNPINE